MEVKLLSNAEKKAIEAEELNAFSGIKILHLKRNVEKILSQIGKDKIFDEYTIHTIEHVDQMLEMLDWIIPDETKEIMTSADWFLLVLSIYYHDVGMLVTKNEFTKRNESEFNNFKEYFLNDENGIDYESSIKKLDEDERERFLYQEFVRSNHAARIKDWITGNVNNSLGVSEDISKLIKEDLKTLNPEFKSDLGIICESHHLNDLDNLTKYKTFQPYGKKNSEAVNLQYIAALLRTVDLLHITSDRTPITLYKLIDPKNPISQKEWIKQMGVRRVKERHNPDKSGINSIDVFATFDNENAFFGLISYINFANEQIKKTFDDVKKANEIKDSKYSFPWKEIFDDNVEAIGFIRENFRFKLDQQKILDLLTGHTLYNDTNIVIRELIQNSIDAIKVEKHDDESFEGKIEVTWDTDERELTIKDNGCGMTQDIIEKHFLSVGSSRYQDQDFIKKYPNFNPISRFGIGILSTFMVADSVEIFTLNKSEEEARKIKMRSVHGKYLIRLLNKKTDFEAKCLLPHGTSIKLKVRESAKMDELLESAKKWIVLPECMVTFKVDKNDEVIIGYNTLKEALETTINNSERFKYRNVIVEEVEKEGISLAYALIWSELFKEWQFVTFDRRSESIGDLQNFYPFGTCVEGIRVNFESPGFRDRSILAICNAKGNNAPKTNVARTNIEYSEEFSHLLRMVYSFYVDHAKNESIKLYNENKYSLTWAVQEARYIFQPLTQLQPLGRKVFLEESRKLPIMLVENNLERNSMSPYDLENERSFWTLDSQLFKTGETFLKELPEAYSLSKIFDSINKSKFNLPNEVILFGFEKNSDLDNYSFKNKEIDEIRIFNEQRRIDIRWLKREVKSRWLNVFEEVIEEFEEYTIQHFIETINLYVINGEIKTLISDPDSEYEAIYTLDNTYLFKQTKLTKYLINYIDRLSEINDIKEKYFVLRVLSIVKEIYTWGLEKDKEKFVSHYLKGPLRLNSYELDNSFDVIIDSSYVNEFINIIYNTELSWKMYNPNLWLRNVKND